MDTTEYYLMWLALQLFVFAAACFFFCLDFRQVKRERKKGQYTIWYHRGFFVTGWLFLIPFLGIAVPDTIITLEVFHGSVLPSSPDFDYQISKHSLSFIIWLSFFSYGVTTILIIYTIFLGIRKALSQRK